MLIVQVQTSPALRACGLRTWLPPHMQPGGLHCILPLTPGLFRDAGAMLDYVCIFTKGGALLWTWSLVSGSALRGCPVDALIRTWLLEERSGESSFTYTPPTGAAYSLKWTLHNVRRARMPLLLPWGVLHDACQAVGEACSSADCYGSQLG